MVMGAVRIESGIGWLHGSDLQLRGVECAYTWAGVQVRIAAGGRDKACEKVFDLAIVGGIL
jgi:hypothetical protein